LDSSLEELEKWQEVMGLFDSPAMEAFLWVCRAEREAQVDRLVYSVDNDERLQSQGMIKLCDYWISGAIKERYTEQAKAVLEPPKPESGDGAGGTPYMEHSPSVSELDG
jgi:hypothetical protein